MTYTAPVRDLMFACTEIADLDKVNALPGYEEANADLLAAILEEAGKFGSEVLAPINWSGDQQGVKLVDGQAITADGWKEAYQQFVEGGWNSLPFDPERGGQGLPWLISTAVQEIWHAANMSFSLCPLLTQGAIEALESHGTEEQKTTYLEKMISGEWTGTMNLTEPQAGSDLSAVRTRAEPEGDHYRIFGQKIYITYGDHDLTDNIIHLVLARLPDAPEGVKGISLFVVPKYLQDDSGAWSVRNDVETMALEDKLGIHASPTAVLGYGNNEGAIGYLVGEPHRGLMYMFTMMNVARHTVGVEANGVAERAYQQAAHFAAERVQGRAIENPDGDRIAIIEHPDIKRLLLLQKSRIEALRSLSMVAAAYMDIAARSSDTQEKVSAQEMVDILIPIVKGYTTEVGLENVSHAVQIHGGMGFIEETGAAQHYRDQRITPIYEGTTGIQALDLAGRKLMRDGGAMANRVVQVIRDEVSDLPTEGDLGQMGESVQAGLDQIEQSIDVIARLAGADIRAAAAVAEPYLRLWGVVCCGWQLALAANVATERLAESPNDSFYSHKLGSARFYFSTEMPKVSTLAATIESSGAVIAESSVDMFVVA
ncbi:MAG: acyl-CoA dehydrogenase [Pseudomonadota bacterium]